MSKGQLNIDLLGTSFAIQANETDEYLNKIYNHYLHVLDQVRQSSSVKDPLKLAILAGILIADELYKEELSEQGSQDIIKDAFDIEKSAMRMIEKINEVI
ncbi:cell division protein ZapA [Treponema denticola]|uniref:cell division protein ZapA n=1 Tax=Treponema denticola TaxID=158 RepID=UPI0021082CD8|nr:cell division protein ZapA [Treponema denticola]UTY23752.1 cell division protein ZapA [Treponema denticola]